MYSKDFSDTQNEHTTKIALQKLGIFTCARADGAIANNDVDLSEVSNHLINLGNHGFNDGNGNYIDPLIIPAP